MRIWGVGLIEENRGVTPVSSVLEVKDCLYIVSDFVNLACLQVVRLLGDKDNTISFFKNMNIFLEYEGFKKELFPEVWAGFRNTTKA